MKIYPVTIGMMQCNCYLLLSEKGSAAVIDPGGTPEKLIELAKELGATIKMVLITHAHFDHIGGMEALCRETGAALYLTAEEAVPVSMKSGISKMASWMRACWQESFGTAIPFSLTS